MAGVEFRYGAGEIVSGVLAGNVQYDIIDGTGKSSGMGILFQSTVSTQTIYPDTIGSLSTAPPL